MKNTKTQQIRSFFRHPDLGLLLMRIMLGVIMIMHGVPKFLGGSKVLENVGEAMEVIGIEFYPVFWGFMAAITEVIGGLLIILGFQFRFASFFLFFTMLIATLMHMQDDLSIRYINQVVAHPLSLACVFLALIFIGPGRFAISRE